MEILKGVFWDIDGTLADTEMQGHRKAFNMAFKQMNLGWYWDKNKYIELLKIGGGRNRIRSYAHSIGQNLEDGYIADMHSLKTNYYNEIIKSGSITLRTGVYRLIEELYFADILQVIVTTSSRKAASSIINKCYINGNSSFKYVLSSEDVTAQKPNPEPYLKALKISQLSNKNIVVIEDSIMGLTSSIRAGLRVLMTLNSWNNYSFADLTLSSSIVDSLGSRKAHSKFIKGRTSKSGYVDLEYLNELLITE